MLSSSSAGFAAVQPLLKLKIDAGTVQVQFEPRHVEGAAELTADVLAACQHYPSFALGGIEGLLNYALDKFHTLQDLQLALENPNQIIFPEEVETLNQLLQKHYYESFRRVGFKVPKDSLEAANDAVNDLFVALNLYRLAFDKLGRRVGFEEASREWEARWKARDFDLLPFASGQMIGGALKETSSEFLTRFLLKYPDLKRLNPRSCTDIIHAPLGTYDPTENDGNPGKN